MKGRIDATVTATQTSNTLTVFYRGKEMFKRQIFEEAKINSYFADKFGGLEVKDGKLWIYRGPFTKMQDSSFEISDLPDIFKEHIVTN